MINSNSTRYVISSQLRGEENFNNAPEIFGTSLPRTYYNNQPEICQLWLNEDIVAKIGEKSI